MSAGLGVSGGVDLGGLRRSRGGGRRARSPRRSPWCGSMSRHPTPAAAVVDRREVRPVPVQMERAHPLAGRVLRARCRRTSSWSGPLQAAANIWRNGIGRLLGGAVGGDHLAVLEVAERRARAEARTARLAHRPELPRTRRRRSASCPPGPPHTVAELMPALAVPAEYAARRWRRCPRSPSRQRLGAKHWRSPGGPRAALNTAPGGRWGLLEAPDRLARSPTRERRCAERGQAEGQ